MKLIQEIARHLHNNSVGSLGSTLFAGYLPDVEGDYSVSVIDTGGMVPDKDILDIKHPTFQIFIRSKTYLTGKNLLDTVRSILHGKINQTLIPGGIYYRRIHALAEGGPVGKDDAGYQNFSINFETEIVE